MNEIADLRERIAVLENEVHNLSKQLTDAGGKIDRVLSLVEQVRGARTAANWVGHAAMAILGAGASALAIFSAWMPKH